MYMYIYIDYVQVVYIWYLFTNASAIHLVGCGYNPRPENTIN